jgi:glycosyltransferase involved in cell wall biosynthesis
MTRIVFVTSSLSTGGAEAMLLKIVRHIDRGRFEPSVISLTSRGEIGARIEELGVPVTALELKFSARSVFAALRLFSLLRKIGPDVVQTWMYHADLLGGLAARLAGIKEVIWGLRNSNLSEVLNKRSTLAVVRICAVLSAWCPQRILSCSNRAAEIHAGQGYLRKKIKFIPNGFDLAVFRPDAETRVSVRKELGLCPNALLVGLMARYDPQKNHAGFMAAAAQIHRGIPNVHFIFAGTGVDEGNVVLRTLIAGYGLEKSTHLLGRRDDMSRLMASLDVLASPSHGEAFSNVLGEAMACGVPCVVTDVGDSAEIVGETGRVVSPGDMEELARHVQEVLSLPPEERARLGRQARARMAANYEIGYVTRLYEEFYDRIVEGNDPCVA